MSLKKKSGCESITIYTATQVIWSDCTAGFDINVLKFIVEGNNRLKRAYLNSRVRLRGAVFAAGATSMGRDPCSRQGSPPFMPIWAGGVEGANKGGDKIGSQLVFREDP